MIPQARFGRTGHQSSRVIFGAAALGAMNPERVAATPDLLEKYGVNHIDVAAGYGNGRAESNLAPWLVDNRSRIFLATKTGQRTGDAARRELESSLERMGVDSVDLIQLHNLVEDEEWETALKSMNEGVKKWVDEEIDKIKYNIIKDIINGELNEKL